MTSKTVKSASGANIEIVDDSDWVQLTGKTLNGLRMWNGMKPAVIRYLWEHGAVTEPTGRATAILYDGITAEFGAVDTSPKSITMLLSDTNNAPAFERKVNGKRCYSIDLTALPRSWYDKLRRDMNGDARAVFEAIPVEVNGNAPHAIEVTEPIEETAEDWIREESVPPIEEPASTLPLDIEIASQVAMSLLTTVVEIISAGTPDSANQKVRQLQTELADVMHKLSARLEENERMRRQLRELGDELQAMRFERDGLRQRLSNTESNLSMALRGDAAAAVNGEIMKRVDRIMREAPKAKGD